MDSKRPPLSPHLKILPADLEELWQLALSKTNGNPHSASSLLHSLGAWKSLKHGHDGRYLIDKFCVIWQEWEEYGEAEP